MAKRDYNGWSRKGLLVTRNRTDSLSLQADLDFPETHCVQFFAENVQLPGLPPRSVAEAIIIWSVGGNNLQRRVSIGNGTSVYGTGQQVNVTLKDATRLSGGAATPLQYKVSVQVAKGVRPAMQQPPILIPSEDDGTWTQGRVNVAGAASSPDITIPKDAGVISVFATAVSPAGTAVPDGSVLLEQRTSEIQRESGISTSGLWLPLSPNAELLRITNTNAFEVQVGILYGIDG